MTPPAPSASFEAPPLRDGLVEHLLACLQWQSTLFHVGQYCGRWKASTAGHGLASFHLVLQGDCHLHRLGLAPLALHEGDAVFFLADEAHHVSSERTPQAACAPQAMRATWPAQEGGTALACGFFEYRSPLTACLLQSLPGPIVLPHDASEPELRAAQALFALMRDEAARTTQTSTERPSPLMARLVDLLLLYLLRHAAHRCASTLAVPGLWSLAGQRDLAPLLADMLADPGRDWTAERMAAVVHLSRAAFFRRFRLVAGEAPAQFLVRLRMVMAAQRLQSGETVERAAEQAGYQSTAAFHRAFARVIGTLPGRYRRLHADATGAVTH